LAFGVIEGFGPGGLGQGGRAELLLRQPKPQFARAPPPAPGPLPPRPPHLAADADEQQPLDLRRERLDGRKHLGVVGVWVGGAGSDRSAAYGCVGGRRPRWGVPHARHEAASERAGARPRLPPWPAARPARHLEVWRQGGLHAARRQDVLSGARHHGARLEPAGRRDEPKRRGACRRRGARWPGPSLPLPACYPPPPRVTLAPHLSSGSLCTHTTASTLPVRSISSAMPGGAGPGLGCGVRWGGVVGRWAGGVVVAAARVGAGGGAARAPRSVARPRPLALAPVTRRHPPSPVTTPVHCAPSMPGSRRAYSTWGGGRGLAGGDEACRQGGRWAAARAAAPAARLGTPAPPLITHPNTRGPPPPPPPPPRPPRRCPPAPPPPAPTSSATPKCSSSSSSRSLGRGRGGWGTTGGSEGLEAAGLAASTPARHSPPPAVHLLLHGLDLGHT
jgi:hypothetical protein